MSIQDENTKKLFAMVTSLKTELATVKESLTAAADRIAELEAKLARVVALLPGVPFQDVIDSDYVLNLLAGLLDVLSDTTPPLAIKSTTVQQDGHPCHRGVFNIVRVPVDIPVGTKVTVVVMGEGK